MGFQKPALALVDCEAPSEELSPGACLSGIELPRLAGDSPFLPCPADMAAWRRIADLQLEKVLTNFDDLLLREGSVEEAAARSLREFQTWVRRSLSALPTQNAMTMLGARAVYDEREAWQKRDQESVLLSVSDPGAVDRHMRLFLAMAHEVTARGYASLLTSS